MSQNILEKWKINNTWTLFLDRDGVINQETFENYITSSKDFVFLEGALLALRNLSSVFKRIIVVTNQQGVGKGLMTEQDLEAVNSYMLEEVRKAGGRIDAVYCATELRDHNSKMRKPNPSMGYIAQQNFPEIEFTKSIMVGNSKTDIEFGENLGMKTVFIGKLDYGDNNFINIKSFADSIISC